MGVLGTALNVGLNSISYFDYKKKGDGTAKALGKTVAQLAAFEVAAPLMMGLMVKDMAVAGFQVANQVGKANAQTTANSYQNKLGGNYQDTKIASTMRQRGLDAIQRNGMNARNVLGSEARQYYRNGY